MTKTDRWNSWTAWEEWHNRDIEILSITTGVSRRTIQRWRQTREIPLWVAVMSRQIFTGAAMPTAVWRMHRDEALRIASKRLNH